MHVRPDHGSQCAMRGTTWMVSVPVPVPASVPVAVPMAVTAVPKPIAVVCSDRWVGVRVSGPADRRRPPTHTCRHRGYVSTTDAGRLQVACGKRLVGGLMSR